MRTHTYTTYAPGVTLEVNEYCCDACNCEEVLEEWAELGLDEEPEGWHSYQHDGQRWHLCPRCYAEHQERLYAY